jgi:hypothetical protein
MGLVGCSPPADQARAPDKPTSQLPVSVRDKIRPFEPSDGPLIKAEPKRAKDIAARGDWFVATEDLRTPECAGGRPNKPLPMVVVASKPGIGRWLGGGLCDVVIRISMDNYNIIYVYDLPCIMEGTIVQNCLEFDRRPASIEDMRQTLQPATADQVRAVMGYELARGAAMPDETQLKFWYVVTAEQFVTTPTYGDQALNLIVLPQSRWVGGQLGHSWLWITGPGIWKVSDNLCHNIRQYGLEALPIKLPYNEQSAWKRCEDGGVKVLVS